MVETQPPGCWRALLAECGHPAGFGVEIGMRYHLAMHRFSGLFMATSGMLREAIGIGLRYLGMAWVFTPITLEEEDTAILTVDYGQIPNDVRAFLTERIAAAAT